MLLKYYKRYLSTVPKEESVGVFAQMRFLVIFWMVLSITPSTHESQKKLLIHSTNPHTRVTFLGGKDLFLWNTFTHNTKMSRRPLPPDPEQLCPRSPLKHPSWTRIAAPRLPMSLVQASGAWDWARQRLFLCFWRQNGTHQKIERWAAHRP
jgi:hypothetical protein